MHEPRDAWQNADSYEQFMGRWSRRIARQFLDWLSVPTNRSWLDVGCGTGTLSSLIVSTAEPSHVVGVDSSPEYITYARETHGDRRLHFEVAAAQSLPTAEQFDAVVSGLMLNFVPDPHGALAEMRRVTRPGGVVAAYVWDYPGKMEMLRIFWDAVVALDPAAVELDEGRRFPLCREGELPRLFEAAGFRSVRSRPVETETVFANFDDYWRPFLGGVGPAPGYAVGLDGSRRRALRERLRNTLPQTAAGTISLRARAWAAQGLV